MHVSKFKGSTSYSQRKVVSPMVGLQWNPREQVEKWIGGAKKLGVSVIHVISIQSSPDNLTLWFMI